MPQKASKCQLMRRKDCDQAIEKTEEHREEQAASNNVISQSLDMSCDEVDPVTAKTADLSVCE